MFSFVDLSKLWDDVHATLSGREFPVRNGAYFEGELAKIEVVSLRRRDGEGYLDLEVIVTPYALRGDLERDIEAGAREAFQEALPSRRTSIREVGALELARLDAPRQSGQEPEERMLLLRRKIGDTWSILLPAGTTQGETAGRGRARFSQVPSDSVCSLEVRPAEAAVQGRTTRRWVGKGAARAEEPGDLGMARLRNLHSQTYTLADRRVTAVLQELPDGGAALTIRTEAPDLAGATVHFQVGDEVREVTLTANPSGGHGAAPRLTQLYRDVARQIPSFEILGCRPE
jgi:hypothetical protein